MSAEALHSLLRPVNESFVVSVRPLAEYKLFEVSESEAERDTFYERAHIPTAVHLSTHELELESTHARRNKSELALALLELGIVPNNTELVVLYGNPDPMEAFRVALIMKWMGKTKRTKHAHFGAMFSDSSCKIRVIGNF